jgi:hypothetical protein
MDHFVKLEKLPDALEFPARLRDRIEYDPRRKGLVYHGPMSKGTFDALSKLHQGREYRRAVEELFRVATFEAEQVRSPKRAVALGLGLAAAAAAAFVIWYVVHLG